MGGKRVTCSEAGESRRLQITISGRVLQYLEGRGATALAPREVWASRGLRAVLDEYLECNRVAINREVFGEVDGR